MSYTLGDSVHFDSMPSSSYEEKRQALEEFFSSRALSLPERNVGSVNPFETEVSTTKNPDTSDSSEYSSSCYSSEEDDYLRSLTQCVTNSLPQKPMLPNFPTASAQHFVRVALEGKDVPIEDLILYARCSRGARDEKSLEDHVIEQSFKLFLQRFTGAWMQHRLNKGFKSDDNSFWMIPEPWVPGCVYQATQSPVPGLLQRVADQIGEYRERLSRLVGVSIELEIITTYLGYPNSFRVGISHCPPPPVPPPMKPSTKKINK